MFYRVDIVKPRRKTKPKTKYFYKLAAKQELSLFYGKIKAYQFKKICLQALRSSTDTMKTIFGLFERRIDAILFRMGIGYSIFHIRQIIAHGMVYVNDKPLKSPNYILTNYDLLTIDPKWRDVFFNLLHKRLTNEHIFLPIPIYLEVNYKTLSAMFIFNPRASLVTYPIKIDVKNALSLYFK
jgi:ribosomal protein S4